MFRTQMTPDGPVDFRTAGPGDAEKIRDFINGLTVRTQFLRFFASVAPPSSGLLRALSGDGGSTEVVLAVRRGEVIGHCMAADRMAADGTMTSDIGLVIADDWQRHGLGTAMLRMVAARAAARGTGMLVMDVLPGNEPILRVLAHWWPDAGHERTADSIIVRARPTAADLCQVA
jgi:GNAT superfamily N-acetyltransferase